MTPASGAGKLYRTQCSEGRGFSSFPLDMLLVTGVGGVTRVPGKGSCRTHVFLEEIIL